MNKKKLILSGLLAGVLIGLAGWGYLLAPSNLVGALIFPIGLYLICQFELHLYTGKIGFIISGKDINVLTNLSIIAFTNMIGAFCVGLICGVFTELIKEPDLTHSFQEAWIILGKAFLCGVLVHLAVKLYKIPVSDFGKFIAIVLPIFLFVLCGFRHCIADSFYYGILMTKGLVSIKTLLTLIITTIGNSVGAILTELLLKQIQKA